MLRPVGPEGLPHRRLDPFHRQQPDRLHDLSALFALVALSVRRRQDDRGADLPRQRRRSGSGRVRRQGGDRIPAEIPAAGGHRHVLLPALRPQRRRRALVHPAADVPEDPRASDHAGNLRQEADRRRRRHRRRSRQDEGRLARPARRRIRGGARLQAEQGRLARRPLVGAQGRARNRGSAPRQYRRRHRRTARDRQEDHDGPARLPRPQDHPALPRSPRQDDRDGRGHRLGDRRGAGLRRAAQGRPPGPPVRPGLGARHLLAAPFGAVRSADRGAPHAVQSSGRGPGALRSAQLDAVGRGRARLRIRLFHRRAERADAVGGAVRRLRQRRAGGVRPVHLVGRTQVAAHVRPRLPAAARLRGPGPGAFLARGSSASCRCARKTTCRWPTSRRRPTTSTSCAGS